MKKLFKVALVAVCMLSIGNFAKAQTKIGYINFQALLAQMPEACGCALGFDRLIMLATGATHIEQVLWSPAPDMA